MNLTAKFPKAQEKSSRVIHKAKHPAKAEKCTKAQIEVFELIATNQFDGGFQQKTIQALLDKGLIEETGTRCVGRDSFGNIDVTEYAVPIPIHIQWCEWCAQQDLEDAA